LAVHAPPSRPRFTADLVAAFPNLTVIEIDAVLAQVRGTIDQVSAVVEAVFYFSLAAACWCCSPRWRLAGRAPARRRGDARARRLAPAAAPGAGSEFAAIGLLSGLAAAGMATLLSGVVAREVFDLPFEADCGWCWRRRDRRAGGGARGHARDAARGRGAAFGHAARAAGLTLRPAARARRRRASRRRGRP
jgi:putative ABC transport system permease protein